MENERILNNDESLQTKVSPRRKDKKRKKRLLMLFLLLLVTGIMLATSTYAWFTSNKTVSVQDIKVNVAAKNGIQLSVDGTTWKSIITSTDILGANASVDDGGKYANAVNQIPTSIEPVSTIGDLDTTTGFMKMFAGTVDTNDGGDYIITATQNTETKGDLNGKFIAFDLFFKVDAATPIYMAPESGVSKAVTGEYTQLTAPEQPIKNASRIGFIVEGNLPNGSTTDAVQALKTNSTDNVYIWEPNYDTHSAAGVKAAKDVYNITTTEAAGSQIPYSGIKADILKTTNVKLGDANETSNTGAYATYFDSVTPSYSTTATHVGFTLFSLQPGITKVRVYMWIEGQDVDCENNASGGDILYNLKVTTEKPAGLA